ncbi:MAG: DUF3093 domain-containing protein [Pseudonocardiaceae bacterium]
MPDGPARSDPLKRPPGAEPAFDERLTVPWWWWPFGLGVVALLAAEVHMGYPGVRAWLPYLLTVPLAVAVLIRMGSHRVRLRGEELHVGRAHVPVRHLGQVQVIPPAGKRRALGPDLDPAAFVLHKAWVRPLVRVELTDPQDWTPYWIFSVRRAADLAALLQAPDAQATDAHRQGSDGHSPPAAPTGA